MIDINRNTAKSFANIIYKSYLDICNNKIMAKKCASMCIEKMKVGCQDYLILYYEEVEFQIKKIEV